MKLKRDIVVTEVTTPNTNNTTPSATSNIVLNKNPLDFRLSFGLCSGVEVKVINLSATIIISRRVP